MSTVKVRSQKQTIRNVQKKVSGCPAAAKSDEITRSSERDYHRSCSFRRNPLKECSTRDWGWREVSTASSCTDQQPVAPQVRFLQTAYRATGINKRYLQYRWIAKMQLIAKSYSPMFSWWYLALFYATILINVLTYNAFDRSVNKSINKSISVHNHFDNARINHLKTNW